MNSLELSLTITLYANALANQLNDQEIELYAAIFNQLADTMTTIQTQRDYFEKKDS